MNAGGWRLRGYDAFSDEWYDLDGQYPDEAAAVRAVADRLAELERRQPSASSGGQAGIQDRVYVVRPDGSTYRVPGAAGQAVVVVPPGGDEGVRDAGWVLVGHTVTGGRLYARPLETWHLAVCRDCCGGRPLPFGAESKRDAWASEHAATTGHQVTREIEHR